MNLFPYLRRYKKYNLKKTKYKDITFIKKLGEGSSGSVYKSIVDNKKCVIKIYSIDNYLSLEDLINDVHNEIHISSLLENTNYCNIINSFSIYNRLNQVNLYLISKYYKNSIDLRDLLSYNFISDNWILYMNHRIDIIKQIILGLKELHNVNVIHSDIKLENIITYKKNNSYKIKIIDYGTCCHLNKDDNYYDKSEYDYHFGTLGYMSSEAYYTNKLYYSSDIYSLFVCILELIVGKIWSNVKKETFKSCINDIKSGLKKIDNLSIKDYIEKCLSLKHSNRYNINHITDNFNYLLKKLI